MVNPGPVSPSLLYMQDAHISTKIWNEGSSKGPSKKLKSRSGGIGIPYQDVLKPILMRCGFYGCARFESVMVDSALITALSERWRPETHTFHFPTGEMTITLQDVAYLYALPIRGRALIGVRGGADRNLIEQFLGIELLAHDEDDTPVFKKSMINVKWLRDNFKSRVLTRDTPQEEVEYYARAYMLLMISSYLLPNSKGDSVPSHYLRMLSDLDQVCEYSWGAAVLATLYRGLCRCALGGKGLHGGLLLQFWSWTRLPLGRPSALKTHDIWKNPPNNAEERMPFGYYWGMLHKFEDSPNKCVVYYRDSLDKLVDSQVNWLPWTEELIRRFPPACRESEDLWMCDLPLINFQIVEPYYPRRVLRQFDKHQSILKRSLYRKKLHADVKNQEHNFPVLFQKEVDWWDSVRLQHYDDDVPLEEIQKAYTLPPFDLYHYRRKYIPWYHKHTRMYMCNRDEPFVNSDNFTTFKPSAKERSDAIEDAKLTALTASKYWSKADEYWKKCLYNMLKPCRTALVRHDALYDIIPLDGIVPDVRRILHGDYLNLSDVDEESGPSNIQAVQGESVKTREKRSKRKEDRLKLSTNQPSSLPSQPPLSQVHTENVVGGKRKRNPVNRFTPSQVERPKKKN